MFLLNPCANAVQSLASAEYLMAPLSSCPPSQAIQLTAICILLLMTFLHCYSTTVTSQLNTAITIIKLGTLLAIVVAGFISAARLPPSLPPPFQGSSSSLSSYVVAIYGGYWSYAGWQVSMTSNCGNKLDMNGMNYSVRLILSDFSGYSCSCRRYKGS